MTRPCARSPSGVLVGFMFFWVPLEDPIAFLHELLSAFWWCRYLCPFPREHLDLLRPSYQFKQAGGLQCVVNLNNSPRTHEEEEAMARKPGKRPYRPS